MPRIPATDRPTFLAYLRQSGLLSAEEIEQVSGLVPEADSARGLARATICAGLLTKFQAEQLLSGRVGGFLLGQYRILDQLGAGGMGHVFKARHVAMHRLVALKVLAPSLVKTARAQQLFLREVRAAAKLVHPNIVTAFDANYVSGRYYLVLEYVDGPTLHDFVRTRGTLPVGQACDVIRQAAAGLECARQQGIVHRDVKPANILLQFGKQKRLIAKVTDFGLARLQPDALEGLETSGTIVTRANTVMGTPDYVSPEQARDLHQVDARSDLYSLGCTFYYALAGRPPFPGGSPFEKLLRHNGEEPTPIEELRPEVAEGVAGVVKRLMAKQPEDRYQTPAEVLQALAPFAVQSSGAWDRASPDSSADVDVRTPVDYGQGSEASFAVGGSDEYSALASTMPPSLIATSISERTLPRIVRDERRRIRQALYWTLGIVGTTAALAGSLAWLLN